MRENMFNVKDMAVSINSGTNADPVGLTCRSADPAAQQRRPTKRCANVVVICYIIDELELCSDSDNAEDA